MAEAIRDLRHDREILNDRIDGLNHVVISMQRRMTRMFEEQRALQARIKRTTERPQSPATRQYLINKI